MLTCAVRHLVRQTKRPHWERQAILSRIRLVRKVPYTAVKIFQKHPRAFGELTHPPDCRYGKDYDHIWGEAGVHITSGGHRILIPVSLSKVCTTLRPKDPIPVPGSTSRKEAIDQLGRVAQALGVKAPDPDVYLPSRVFQCNGEELRATRKFAEELSSVAYVRIVDKGPGLLWGFCKRFI